MPPERGSVEAQRQEKQEASSLPATTTPTSQPSGFKSVGQEMPISTDNKFAQVYPRIAQQDCDGALRTKFQQQSPVTYLVYAVEGCPDTGSFHLQTYMQFAKQPRQWIDITWNLIDDLTACVDKARGSANNNQVYCKEEGWIVEMGDMKLNGEGGSDDNLSQRIQKAIEEVLTRTLT